MNRIFRRGLLSLLVVAAVVLSNGPRPHAQDSSSGGDALHKPFDEVLDLYVRDGLVYYLALRSDRGKLDRYIASLGSQATATAYPGWTRDEQAAFWINAYNAFVLRTVIDQYPIRGRAKEYPSASIRQIPGAFERLTHRAAGRSVTLDTIDKMILPEFKDPRLHLALGRGAIGSPRLRSEAFTGQRLEAQLKSVETECPTRSECIIVDTTTNRIAVTSVVGWHEGEFVTNYGNSGKRFTSRSPVERAVLAFIEPNLFATEREFLDKDQFRVTYSDFNWELNDLTGRSR
ncbi:MAG: DUF547 domain-containing protein [Acidobacteria bacterium]|nr:MAG: DUF547 domain-containing protein [Acidobacteriota bacterium]